MNNFKTLINSAETCIQMMLGRFNFDAMNSASRYFGSIGFVVYVISCAFILVNMFLSILNESFTRVRLDISLQSNEHEIVDFMVHRFKVRTFLFVCVRNVSFFNVVFTFILYIPDRSHPDQTTICIRTAIRMII